MCAECWIIKFVSNLNEIADTDHVYLNLPFQAPRDSARQAGDKHSERFIFLYFKVISSQSWISAYRGLESQHSNPIFTLSAVSPSSPSAQCNSYRNQENTLITLRQLEVGRFEISTNPTACSQLVPRLSTTSQTSSNEVMQSREEARLASHSHLNHSPISVRSTLYLYVLHGLVHHGKPLVWLWYDFGTTVVRLWYVCVLWLVKMLLVCSPVSTQVRLTIVR